MALFLKVLRLKNHPVKRSPLPFLFYTANAFGETMVSRKSNSLPPNWEQQNFCFKALHECENLTIVVHESRLLMAEEELGYCKIPISKIPLNQIIVQWANLTPTRQKLPKMEMLLMIYFSDDSNYNIFNDENPQFQCAEMLDYEPWIPRNVENEYLKQTPLYAQMKDDRDQNEESSSTSILSPLFKYFAV